MPPVASLSRRVWVPVLLCGLAIVAAGAVLQLAGVALPAMLGRTSTFGILAQGGGAVALCGLALFALAELLDGDPRRDARFSRVGSDLPAAVTRGPGARGPEARPTHGALPAVTPQQVAAWQMRLAERTVHLEAAHGHAPNRRRVGQELHRAALAIIAGALACLLFLTAWGHEGQSPGRPDLAEGAAPGLAAAGGQTALALLGLIGGAALFLVSALALWRRWRRGHDAARRRYRDLATG